MGGWGPPQLRSTWGLEDYDGLPHPQAIHDPPTRPPSVWVQVWDGNSSNKLGRPLSQGWGPREGAGERVRRQLPASYFPAVYAQAMSCLLASVSSHLARCARAGWLPSARFQLEFETLFRWVWTPEGNGVGPLKTYWVWQGACCSCHAGQAGRAGHPWALRHEACRNGVGRFSYTLVGQTVITG